MHNLLTVNMGLWLWLYLWLQREYVSATLYLRMSFRCMGNCRRGVLNKIP